MHLEKPSAKYMQFCADLNLLNGSVDNAAHRYCLLVFIIKTNTCKHYGGAAGFLCLEYPHSQTSFCFEQSIHMIGISFENFITAQ